MHHPPTLHFQTQTYNFLKKRDKYARMTVLQKNKLMIYDEYTFHRFIYASAFCNRYLWHHYDMQTFISSLIKTYQQL